MQKVALVLVATFLFSSTVFMAILARPITNLVGHFAFWEIGKGSMLAAAVVTLVVAAIYPRIVRAHE